MLFDEQFRRREHRDVFAAGADIDRGARDSLALEDLDAMCILDAGNGGVIFKASHVLAHNGDGKPARARIMAGLQAHWAKLAFERFYLASRRRGVLAF